MGNCGHLIKVNRFWIARFSNISMNVYFADTIRIRFWMFDTPWIQLVRIRLLQKQIGANQLSSRNKSRIKKIFMFLPWIIGEGEKSWVNRFKVNKYVIIDKPSQLDAGMFAPDFFSLKFDDDLFQNLKIDIMKNEKMPHQFWKMSGW